MCHHCRAGSFILFADQYESFREVTDLTRNLQRTLGAVCAFDGESDSVEFSIGRGHHSRFEPG